MSAILTVAEWLIVDAVLDNRISTEMQSGDPDAGTVTRASALRERAWAASSAHPLRGRGPVGWPPTDSPLGIEFDASDIAFLVAELDGSIATTRRILASAGLSSEVRVEQERDLALGPLARAALLRARDRLHLDASS